MHGGENSILDAGGPHFALCVRNEEYAASLEVRKVYRLLGDPSANKHHQVRVIDESGEDYLYPKEYFVPIKLPQAAPKSRAAGHLISLSC